MGPFFTEGCKFPETYLTGEQMSGVYLSPFTRRIVMVCRCCNDIPLRCNHSARHINFIRVEKHIYHLCSFWSNSQYTWTYNNLTIKVTLVRKQGLINTEQNKRTFGKRNQIVLILKMMKYSSHSTYKGLFLKLCIFKVIIQMTLQYIAHYLCHTTETKSLYGETLDRECRCPSLLFS